MPSKQPDCCTIALAPEEKWFYLEKYEGERERERSDFSSGWRKYTFQSRERTNLRLRNWQIPKMKNALHSLTFETGGFTVISPNYANMGLGLQLRVGC